MKAYPSQGCLHLPSPVVIAGLVPLLSGLRSTSGKTGCHRVCGSPPSQPPPVKGGGNFLSRFNNFPLPLRRGRAGVGVSTSQPQAVRHGAFDLESCDYPLALAPCKTTLSDKRKKAKPDSSGRNRASKAENPSNAIPPAYPVRGTNGWHSRRASPPASSSAMHPARPTPPSQRFAGRSQEACKRNRVRWSRLECAA